MSAELSDLVERLGQPRVLVIGDLMLDRYVWGDAERISQEAPVILLHADKREERLGGASSVFGHWVPWYRSWASLERTRMLLESVKYWANWELSARASSRMPIGRVRSKNVTLDGPSSGTRSRSCALIMKSARPCPRLSKSAWGK
jgi:hypothetical protein